MRRLALACLLLVGCGASRPAARSASGGPAWASEPDRTERGGNVFTCEGAAATQDEAFGAAKQLCSDKLCKLCGVKIESRVEVKETLNGVQMQRKVVERCTRARTREMEVRYRQDSCGPDGCRSWVQTFYSSADQEKECKRFSDENFADPAQCQKILEDFARVPGLTSAAFQRRYDLLLAAEAACAEIDVRPTPLMETLDEHLWMGIGQIAKEVPQLAVFGKCRPKEPVTECDGKTYSKAEFQVARQRDKMEKVRTDLANEYYTFPDRQSLKTTPNFGVRIQTAIGWAAEHVKTYAAIDALTDYAGLAAAGADTHYTPDGLARIVAAFRAAPKTALGRRDRPVHFWVLTFLFLSEKMPEYGRHSSFTPPPYLDDVRSVSQAIRDTLSSVEAANLGVADDVSRLFALDDQLDETEWQYVMAMNRALEKDVYWQGPLALTFALHARQHGGFEIHKARLLEALKDKTVRVYNDLPLLLPEDGALIQAVWPALPDRFRLGFERVLSIYEGKAFYLSADQRRWLLEQLEATIAGKPNKEDCEKLPERLDKLAILGRKPPADRLVCACFETLNQPRQPSLFGRPEIQALYRQQAARGLDCLMPGARR